MKSLLVALALLSAAAPGLPAQSPAPGMAIIQKMISIVVEHNPILASEQRLIDESERLPRQDLEFLIPGVSIGAGFGTWNPQTNTYAFLPNLTVGLSFALSDPARATNIFRLQQDKEKVRQDLETARVAALSQLFSKIREIAKLRSQARSQLALKKYLEDFSAAAETQSFAQPMAPDKLWDLKERLANLEADLSVADAQIDSMMLETAMSLGGDAWQDLLDLLRQLDAQS